MGAVVRRGPRRRQRRAHPEDASRARRRRVGCRRRDGAARLDARLRRTRRRGMDARARAEPVALLVDTLRERATEPTEIAALRSARCCVARARPWNARASSAARSARWSTANRSRRARRSTCTRSAPAFSVVRVPLVRREGHPQGAGRHGQRRRARRRGRRAASPARDARRRPDDLRMRALVPGVGARRRRAPRARQPGLGDVRLAPGRATRTRSSGSTRSGADRAT